MYYVGMQRETNPLIHQVVHAPTTVAGISVKAEVRRGRAPLGRMRHG